MDQTELFVEDELLIHVVNANDAPEFINLPQSVDLEENAQRFDAIFNITYIDADGPNALWSMTSYPSTPVFEITEKGRILLKAGFTLNYEAQSKFVLEVTLSDGIDDVTANLTISVTDEAEEPIFDTLPSVIAVQEDEVMDELYEVKFHDDDKGDEVKLELNAVYPLGAAAAFELREGEALY